jgi:hypothetical protein
VRRLALPTQLSEQRLSGGTVVVRPADVDGPDADLKINFCQNAYIYVLAPVRFATLLGCSNCTVVVGAVRKCITVEHCEGVKVVCAARRVRLCNSVDCDTFAYTPEQPLILGDCRGLRIAPYNAHYPDLEAHVVEAGLASFEAEGGSREGAFPAGGVPGKSSGSLRKTAAREGKEGRAEGKEGRAEGKEGKAGSPPTPHGSHGSHVGAAGTHPAAAAGRAPAEGKEGKAAGPAGKSTHWAPADAAADALRGLSIADAERPRLRLAPNLWAQPLSQTRDFSAGDLLLPPAQFSALAVPVVSRKTAAGTGAAAAGTGARPPCTDKNPFPMPRAYFERLQQRRAAVAALQQRIKAAGLTAEQRAQLQAAITARFQEWLLQTRHIRQLSDLVKLEGATVERREGK